MNVHLASQIINLTYPPFWCIILTSGEGKHRKPERRTAMAKSMKELNDGLKKRYYDMIEELAQEKEIETLRVPLTDASNSVAYRLAIPELDEENNEKGILKTYNRFLVDSDNYDKFKFFDYCIVESFGIDTREETYYKALDYAKELFLGGQKQ